MISTDRWLRSIRDALVLALAAAGLSACGTSPVSGPTYTMDSGHQTASPRRHQVVRNAVQQIGTPYRYGGGNRGGFDCSGLVQYAHREAGVDVPRTTASQFAQARVPDRQGLLPGDLLFFEIDWQKRRHVGIYEGGGMFIHAPSTGKRVSRASLENPYWGQRLVATRTFL